MEFILDKDMLNLITLLNCILDVSTQSVLLAAFHEEINMNLIIDTTTGRSIKHCKLINQKVNYITFNDDISLANAITYCPDANLILHLQVNNSDDMGCSVDEVWPIIDQLLLSNLDLYGIYFYPETIGDFDTLFLIINELLAKTLVIRTVYIGNSFLTNYIDSLKVIEPILNSLDQLGINLIVDVTRYLLLDTCTFLTKVTGKRIRTDANGINHAHIYLNDGLYGSLNDSLLTPTQGSFHPLKKRDGTILTTLFGPTCDSIDTIVKDIDFPNLEIDDWLCISGIDYMPNNSTNFNAFTSSMAIFYCK